MNIYDNWNDELIKLKENKNYRSFPHIVHRDKFVIKEGREMINFSSNDYLGIATEYSLRTEFLKNVNQEELLFSASSSRLLTGNFSCYDRLEKLLTHLFDSEAALTFNSGYHMNIGILPAISDSNTLVIADKLVHASIIDGIRLTGIPFERYRHNDYAHLEKILCNNFDRYRRIIVVTESIFSMDGDEADLKRLVAFKSLFPNMMLYVDEAHAIGLRGEKGLGCAEQYGCIKDIDFLCGTFGKAIGSIGAYIICNNTVRELLINRMRPLIFTTALPPINILWTEFILQRLYTFKNKREHLHSISILLKDILEQKGYSSNSTSHILPLVTKQSQLALLKAEEMHNKGFYVLPVRPPTVPENGSRLRFSLTSNISVDDIMELKELL